MATLESSLNCSGLWCGSVPRVLVHPWLLLWAWVQLDAGGGLALLHPLPAPIWEVSTVLPFYGALTAVVSSTANVTAAEGGIMELGCVYSSQTYSGNSAGWKIKQSKLCSSCCGAVWWGCFQAGSAWVPVPGSVRLWPHAFQQGNRAVWGPDPAWGAEQQCPQGLWDPSSCDHCVWGCWHAYKTLQLFTSVPMCKISTCTCKWIYKCMCTYIREAAGTLKKKLRSPV